VHWRTVLLIFSVCLFQTSDGRLFTFVSAIFGCISVSEAHGTCNDAAVILR
jgi:hypothetical protein